MIVSELIEKLRLLPQDKIVYVQEFNETLSLSRLMTVEFPTNWDDQPIDGVILGTT